MSVVVRGKRRPVRPDSIHVLRGKDTRRRILEAARAASSPTASRRCISTTLRVTLVSPRRPSSSRVGGKASILLCWANRIAPSRLEVPSGDATKLRTGCGAAWPTSAQALRARSCRGSSSCRPTSGTFGSGSAPTTTGPRAHIDGRSTILLTSCAPRAGPTRDRGARSRRLRCGMMAGYVIGLRDLYTAFRHRGATRLV